MKLASEYILEMRDITKKYGENAVLSGVSLKVKPGEIHALVGENGAGKSTFIKILSGELEPSTGSVTIAPKKRMSVLKQNQNMYDDYTVMDTVIMGNRHLYDVGKEMNALYEKEDFSDEDGLRAALAALEDEAKYGAVLRAKGIVAASEGEWIHFDYTPGEQNIRKGPADYTGRLCVIGSKLADEKLAKLFGVA